MRKTFIYICVILLFFSCRKDSSSYKEELRDNIKTLNNLLNYIEKKYSNEFLKRTQGNIVIFTNCTDEEEQYSTMICDDKNVLEQMENIGITEISFEKYSDNCDLNNGFNQVNFKLKKGALDYTVYYRYEYCGTSKSYKSNTIEYEPVDSSWSVFIDTSVP